MRKYCLITATFYVLLALNAFKNNCLGSDKIDGEMNIIDWSNLLPDSKLPIKINEDHFYSENIRLLSDLNNQIRNGKPAIECSPEELEINKKIIKSFFDREASIREHLSNLFTINKDYLIEIAKIYNKIFPEKNDELSYKNFLDKQDRKLTRFFLENNEKEKDISMVFPITPDFFSMEQKNLVKNFVDLEGKFKTIYKFNGDISLSTLAINLKAPFFHAVGRAKEEVEIIETEAALKQMATIVKKLSISNDSTDDIITLLGQPSKNEVAKDFQIYSYKYEIKQIPEETDGFFSLYMSTSTKNEIKSIVTADIYFSLSGKLLGISVTKNILESGSIEEIFRSGETFAKSVSN
jgi:hypothetical protein